MHSRPVAALGMHTGEAIVVGGVVAGAGVGTLSGVLFERYNRAFPNNVFNRAFLPATIVPERGGARVAWSVPLQ